jgi:uncharacterized protein
MTVHSTAFVPTDNASLYLRQLCKHWSHNLAVEFAADKGIVIFPRDARSANWPGHATLKMQADARNLECRLTASAREQLEALKSAVARHLDRFAFREGSLRFEWQDAEE